MVVSVHLYSPAVSCTLPGERAPVPIGKEAGWLQQPVWTYRRREQFFAPARIRSPDRPARSVVTKCNRFKSLYNGASPQFKPEHLFHIMCACVRKCVCECVRARAPSYKC